MPGVAARGEGWAAMSEEWLRATSRPVRPVKIDTSVPNVARVWNYLVGGRDNFEADRRAARLLISVAPVMAEAGPASRAFLRRAVTYLAAEAGIRQFLDIGTGMPTAGNTHEVAQAAAPGAASSTSITTRSCWRTRAPCCARRRAASASSTRTPATPPR